MAAGSLLGYWFSAMLKVYGQRRSILMFGAMLIFACSLMLLSQSHSSVVSLFSLFMAGFCLGVFNLQAMTLLQTSTPSAIRGRVMSLLMTLSTGLLPLGLLVGGGLGALTGNDTQFIFALCSVGIALLTTLTSLNANVRSFLF